jgi:hypothetical protein
MRSDAKMYEAPITIITGQMKYEIENEIYRAVQEVGVSVDKEEIIKALQYDREQYIKGYTDGIKEFAEKLKKDKQRFRDVMLLINWKDWFDEVIDYELKEMVGETE